MRRQFLQSNFIISFMSFPLTRNKTEKVISQIQRQGGSLYDFDFFDQDYDNFDPQRQPMFSLLSQPKSEHPRRVKRNYKPHYRRTPSEQKEYVRQLNDQKKKKALTKVSENIRICSIVTDLQQFPSLLQNSSTHSPNHQKKNIILGFLPSENLIPIQHLLSPMQCRKLKQVTLAILPQAVKLEIVSVPGSPIILVQYSNLTKDIISKKHYIDAIEVVANNNLANTKIDTDSIIKMYGKLFMEVKRGHFQIKKYATLIRERNIKSFNGSEEELLTEGEQQKLFYSILENTINFVFITGSFKAYYFSSQQIEAIRHENSLLYQLYLDFKKQVTFDQIQIKKNQFYIEQLDSDQDRDLDFAQYQETDGNFEKQIREKMKKSIELHEVSLKDLEARVQQLVDEQAEEHDEKHKLVLNNSITIMEESSQSIKAALANFNNIQKNYFDQLKDFKNQKRQQMGCYLLKKVVMLSKQLQTPLPIVKNKAQIFEHLKIKNILILEGTTGSGKSTQLPQFMLQLNISFGKDKFKPILVTQPRKVAVRTLASRVSEQLEERIHTLVTYQTSSHQKINPFSRIIFKLDKLVLDQLQSDCNLDKYSCIIIDEAHERTISIDVILARVKQICKIRKDFKVIITSASMNTQLFQSYFDQKSIKIQSPSYFVEQIFYPIPQEISLLKKVQSLFKNVIMDKPMENISSNFRGHILVFTSGYEEAYKLYSYFFERLNLQKFKILLLHARSTCEEQKQVFRESKKTKIIFATNIAETSITIKGVTVVIDPGYDKQIVYNEKSRISSAQIRLISLSSAKQRAGRAGRTCNGFCFRIYEKSVKEKMKTNKDPQIKNMSLGHLILKLKSLVGSKIESFPFIEKPDEKNLAAAIKGMKMIGCLDDNEQLTEIGKVLQKIEMDPFLSRSIIQALIIKQLLSQEKNYQTKLDFSKKQMQLLKDNDIVITVAKILSMLINCSSLYTKPQKETQKSIFLKLTKLFENKQQEGDFFILEKIFNKFVELLNSNSPDQLEKWVTEHNLDKNCLIQSKQTFKQIMMILHSINADFSDLTKCYWGMIKKLGSFRKIAVSCLCLSLLPNLCLYSNNQTIGYTLISEQTSVKLSKTSFLSIQNMNPKWILADGFYFGDKGEVFCKFAQKIEFQILTNALPKKMLYEYNLEEIQKFNPFYKCIRKKLPTIVFTELYQNYKNRSDICQFKFLQNYDINFNLQDFAIEAYYLTKKQSISSSKSLSQLLQSHIHQITQIYSKSFKHEYLDKIQVQLKDGFGLDSISLDSERYMIKLFTKQADKKRLITFNCSQYGQVFQYFDKVVVKLERSSDRKQCFEKILKIFRSQQIIDKIVEEIIDTRLKIPKMRLRIEMVNGTAIKSSHIFMYYKDRSIQNVKQYTIEMYKYLLQAQVKMIEREQKTDFRYSDIVLSKTGKGINYYSEKGDLDEAYLKKLLLMLREQGKLNENFRLPQAFLKYRKPFYHYRPKDWRKEALELLNKYHINEQKISLKISGKSVTYSEYEKIFPDGQKCWTSISADIFSFDKGILENLKKMLDQKNQADSKYNIINTQIYYIHRVATPALDVYNALSQQFKKILSRLKKSHPLVQFVISSPKTIGTGIKVPIQLHAKDKADLKQPTELIQNLFKAKIMKVNHQHRNFFDRQSGHFNGFILNQLEQYFKFQVHFSFNQINSNLYIYCPMEAQMEIRELITKRLQLVNAAQKTISYKGKSLRAVEELLKQFQYQYYQQNFQTNQFSYEFNYSTKNFRIQSQLSQIQSIFLAIQRLDGGDFEMKGQVTKQKMCKICYDPLLQPYCLFNCQHMFCQSCLVDYIKQSGLEQELIKCPEGENCQKKINIRDIKRILPEQQFLKLCDRKTQLYVEKSKQYHRCYTPDCQQIFQKKSSVQKMGFQCGLCGIWYCLHGSFGI